MQDFYGFFNNSDALLGGGYNAPAGTAIANTESWNGSSWTELADLATARSNSGSGGGSSSSNGTWADTTGAGGSGIVIIRYT